MKKGKYIYGIIETNERKNFGRIGIGNPSGNVHTIHHKDIAAVVSDSPIIAYEPNRENALAHERVIREIMKDYTIIPMGFGILAKNEKDVEKILKRSYVEIKNMLEKIAHNIQVNVKALWDSSAILKEVLGKNKKIQKLTKTVAKKSPGQTFNERVKLGKMVKSALDRKKDEYVKEVRSALDKFSEDSRECKLTDDRMIMNVSFLVNRNREKEFRDKVDELDEKFGEKIEVISVGPLPAYNFTNLRMKKVEFESVDAARKVLGLSEEATMSEIKSAYRKLAYEYHPDRNPDESAKELFKKIEEAYTLLKDYCNHYLCSFRRPEVEKTILITEELSHIESK